MLPILLINYGFDPECFLGHLQSQQEAGPGSLTPLEPPSCSPPVLEIRAKHAQGWAAWAATCPWAVRRAPGLARARTAAGLNMESLGCPGQERTDPQAVSHFHIRRPTQARPVGPRQELDLPSPLPVPRTRLPGEGRVGLDAGPYPDCPFSTGGRGRTSLQS